MNTFVFIKLDKWGPVKINAQFLTSESTKLWKANTQNPIQGRNLKCEKMKEHNSDFLGGKNAMFALILALITQYAFSFFCVYLSALCQLMNKMCAAAHVFA